MGVGVGTARRVGVGSGSERVWVRVLATKRNVPFLSVADGRKTPKVLDQQ